jgi:hypothetical protein
VLTAPVRAASLIPGRSSPFGLLFRSGKNLLRGRAVGCAVNGERSGVGVDSPPKLSLAHRLQQYAFRSSGVGERYGNDVTRVGRGDALALASPHFIIWLHWPTPGAGLAFITSHVRLPPQLFSTPKRQSCACPIAHDIAQVEPPVVAS